MEENVFSLRRSSPTDVGKRVSTVRLIATLPDPGQDFVHDSEILRLARLHEIDFEERSSKPLAVYRQSTGVI